MIDYQSLSVNFDFSVYIFFFLLFSINKLFESDD
jgi:hypothetical protein